MARPIAVTMAIMIMFCFTFPTIGHAQTVQSLSSPPILKINDYNVFFTYPSAPFIDKQGRAQVPLRSLGDLLGANVTYYPKSRSATIALNSHILTVTMDSNKIRADGRIYEMDTVPVMVQNSLFIPIRVLLDHLQVKGTYRAGLIELTDRRYMNSIRGFISNLSSRLEVYSSVRAFRIEGYHLQLSNLNSGNSWKGTLQITARNASNRIIPDGEDHLQPVVLYADGSIDTDFAAASSSSQDIQPGALIQRIWVLQGDQLPQYIVMRGNRS